MKCLTELFIASQWNSRYSLKRLKVISKFLLAAAAVLAKALNKDFTWGLGPRHRAAVLVLSSQILFHI